MSYLTTAGVLSVILLGLAMPAPADPGAGAAAPRVFLWDANSLAAARRRIAAGDKDLAPLVESLKRQADEALKQGPFSVIDKKETPPSGDKHDYMSMGPYWWPDPNKPDGKPYIRRDGEVYKARGELDNAPMGKMASTVNVLAAAYYLTGHEPYAQHAAKLLRAWFLDDKTRMNPNLNYGQAIPGITDGRGVGIIDTTCLVELVDSVGLLEGSKDWAPADRKALQAWFQKYLAWLTDSKLGQEEARAKNNHGTWYDVQVAIFALFVGRQEIAKKVLAEARQRIASQIEPDGRQPLELARTKSWDYSAMNLRGFFFLARLGEHVGEDLWRFKTPDGRCIRGALDYLVPYLKDKERWATKQITALKPDRLALPLRLAAVRFGEPKYQERLEEVLGARKDWRLELLWPRP
jgi:hypothetical protein